MAGEAATGQRQRAKAAREIDEAAQAFVKAAAAAWDRAEQEIATLRAENARLQRQINQGVWPDLDALETFQPWNRQPSDDPDGDRGLYDKYVIYKAATGARVTDPCFVLSFHDPHAVAALRAYAESCEEDFPALAEDLRQAVDQCAGGNHNLMPVPGNDPA